ncbi:2Fe-2S iron-sulfur cluster-binding protein [Rhizobium sp. 2YAF20]|uniref:PDR/VanB family oxidoreductase n=1 Tax=Rhizobium sp. 2YAF20 TaxID=3233027 RepID=UPI003F95ED66
MNDTETRSLRVEDVVKRADHVVELVLADAQGQQLPSWQPGAHLSLKLGPGLERQYSLCGPLGDSYHWRVAVLRANNGRGGSEYIHEKVKKGDILEAQAPRNHFPLEPASEYIFVAGGIGITPILPMIEQATSSGTRWVLHYGGRSRSSMSYHQELEALGDHVRIVPEDQAGLLDLKAIGSTITPGAKLYSCGPEGLLNALTSLSSSWPKDTLHLERFSPISVTTPVQNREFTAHLRASGRSISVGVEESILEAMAREGIRWPCACREGTCGSCETRVLSGAIDHRDSVLSASEQEQGDWMMICVSRALGSEIELDA